MVGLGGERRIIFVNGNTKSEGRWLWLLPILLDTNFTGPDDLSAEVNNLAIHIFCGQENKM